MTDIQLVLKFLTNKIFTTLEYKRGKSHAKHIINLFQDVNLKSIVDYYDSLNLPVIKKDKRDRYFNDVQEFLPSSINKYCDISTENIKDGIISQLEISDKDVYDKTDELPDSSVELVTLFMSLNRERDVDKLILEVKRVLKSGGKLIIREHNADSRDFINFLDIVYFMYSVVINKEQSLEEFQSHKLCFNSREFWNQKISKHLTLEKTTTPKYGNVRVQNMFKTFYSVFINE